MNTLITGLPRRMIVPVIITHGQLGALIEVLQTHEARKDEPAIFPISGTVGLAPFVLDLRVCPIAIARMARCFDYDPGVINILDEAQFEQLRVTVSKAHRTGDIVMTLSSRADALPSIAQMVLAARETR